MKPDIFKKIIHICLYLSLVSPLLVWGKFLFPYITPKTLFFRILIEIALFFYILLIIYKPEYRPRFSKITWAVFIYLMIMTFTSIFGMDLYRSFWGNIERGEGLLTIYHFFIFFLLITNVFKEKKEWIRFFDISVLISFLVGLYALAQRFEFDFLLRSSGGTRLAGTIGNPSFLAAYMLMNAFLILFLLANKEKLIWRVYYGLIFAFEAYIVFETQTRGALLGFVGGLLILSFLSVIFSKNRRIKLGAVSLILILFILGTGVWIVRDHSFVKNVNTLHRLTTISFNDVTTQTRILGWQGAWQSWKDRFFLGYGYENYNVAFNKYFPVLIYHDAGSRVWFDRAHNIILDQAMPGGIFGLLSYLGILSLALWFLWVSLRRFKHKEDSSEGPGYITNNYSQIGFVALIALIVAYFGQNFFVFDTLGTYIIFYSVLGFLAYLSIDSNSAKGVQDVSNDNQSGSDIHQPRIFLIIVLALILVFSVYVFNIRPGWANTTSVKALSYAYADRYREAMVEYKKALSYKTNQSQEIRHNLSKTVIQSLQSGQFSQEEAKANIDFAVMEMKKNLRESPKNARHYMFAINLYSKTASYDRSFYDQVIDLSEKALVLSPDRPQFYYSIGQAKLAQGKYEEGVEAFEKAVELKPDVTESRWNLAAAYIIAGQDDLADSEFAALEELGFEYRSWSNLQRLIRPYLVRQNFNKIAFLYEEMVKLDPSNPDLYAKLAAAYKETGEFSKARQAVAKAVELDPGFAEEAELFLQLLEQ